MHLRDSLRILADLFNLSAWICVAFLFVNFAFADWSWNPIYDLLFARTQGLILAWNHVSSVFAVLLVVVFLMLKDRDHAFRWLFATLGIVTLHDMILSNVMIFLTASTVFYLSFRWIFWLIGIWMVALCVVNQLRFWMYMKSAVLMLVIDGVWAFAIVHGINPQTIIHAVASPMAGPAYFQILPNAFEVFSWIIPMVYWLYMNYKEFKPI